jgi:hypothetical protein
MTNPFSSRDKTVDSIADIMNKNRESASMDDTLKNAAVEAGQEVRNAGNIPVETKTSIYNKHFTKAIGDSPTSTSSRADFEGIADAEINRTD